jgi:Flp pilus assembly pilin Flp
VALGDNLVAQRIFSHLVEIAMLTLMARLVREDIGQDLIEYGLLAALISLVAVLAITNVGKALILTYEDLAANLP